MAFTPATVRPEEHLWLILSNEAIRKELRHSPQPDLQRGIINSTRYVRKVIAPGAYGTLSDVKDLKRKRSLMLAGRKDGKSFFEDSVVLNFLGFGSQE